MQKRLIFLGLFFTFTFTSFVSLAKKLDLSDAIKQVRKQGVQIIYSDQYLKTKDYPLDKKILNHSIGDLKNLLNSIGFELVQIKELFYVIKPKKNRVENIQTGTVIIALYDINSKQPVKNSTIEIVNNTDTNVYQSNGIYSIIDLAREEYLININSDDYLLKAIKIDLTNRNTYSNEIFLEPKPKKLENILVTTSKYSFQFEDSASKKILYAQELSDTPAIGNDPTRAISRLPGLTSNGISARSYARGGKLNESGIVINGLYLNNPFHFNDLFGIFSIIDLSYTQDVALYAGVFPAKYGNYISSVMEVTSIQPDRPFFIDGSIGLFNSRITMGGKLSNFSSYVASFRSGGDFFKDGFLPINVGNPEYDDGFFSLSHDFNNGLKIQGNLLFSTDEIFIDIANENETANAKQSNDSLWLSIEDSRFDDIAINSLLYLQKIDPTDLVQ